MKRFLIGLAAASVAVLTQGVATAATPQYDVSCVVGGATTATWRHAKLEQATFEWFVAGSATAYASITVPITPHPPHGSIVTSAGTIPGFTPAEVHVSFERARGSGSDPVEVACN